MADYPEKLLYDYQSKVISDDFGIDGSGQPMFEITDNAAATTTYRFATHPTSGCCYLKFDADEL